MSTLEIIVAAIAVIAAVSAIASSIITGSGRGDAARADRTNVNVAPGTSEGPPSPRGANRVFLGSLAVLVVAVVVLVILLVT